MVRRPFMDRGSLLTFRIDVGVVFFVTGSKDFELAAIIGAAIELCANESRIYYIDSSYFLLSYIVLFFFEKTQSMCGK